MTASASPWLRDQPITHSRRVRWGECDPAGVVYTPRFSDYAVEAFHDFMQELLEGPLSQKLAQLDLGTPMKAMQFVFHRSLWPDQEFVIRSYGGDIRTRSFDLQMEASDAAGQSVFSARLSVICVHNQRRESQAIPPALLERLRLYGARFPAPPPA
ncbi:MAG: acyl-CoA thioesterase [Pseudomonadota bacterium]